MPRHVLQRLGRGPRHGPDDHRWRRHARRAVDRDRYAGGAGHLTQRGVQRDLGDVPVERAVARPVQQARCRAAPGPAATPRCRAPRPDRSSATCWPRCRARSPSARAGRSGGQRRSRRRARRRTGHASGGRPRARPLQQHPQQPRQHGLDDHPAPPPAIRPSTAVSPGVAAVPTTKDAHTATVTAAAAHERSWNCTATTVKDAIGDTQPRDATSRAGSTSSGWARHSPHIRTTSTPYVHRYRRSGATVRQQHPQVDQVPGDDAQRHRRRDSRRPAVAPRTVPPPRTARRPQPGPPRDSDDRTAAARR